MKQQIFISYKRDDKELVFKVKKEIMDNSGVDCWIDLTGIESGDGIGGKICNAIENADVCVFMLTKAFASPYIDKITQEVKPDRPTFCGDEVIYAKGQGKRLIPVSLDGTMVKDIPCGDVRFALTGTDYIDYQNPDQRKKFYKNLRDWCGDPLGLNELERQEDEMEAKKRQVEERKQKLRMENLLIEEMEKQMADKETKTKEKNDIVVSKQEYTPQREQVITKKNFDWKKFGKWCGVIGGVAVAVVLCLFFVFSGINTPKKLNAKGDSYFYGNGVEKDYQKAAEYYRKSAEKGDTAGINRLALMYYYGYGVAQDYAKAAEWYEKSAELGNAMAQGYLATMYYEGIGVSKNYSKAAEWYEKSAQQGNAEAQCWIGHMYYYSIGVSQNFAKAAEWYRKSAEQGNAIAQYYVGYFYDNGLGVSKDFSEAKKWYERSANQGNADAQYQLGIICMAEENYAKARYMFEKSADQGNADAKYELMWMDSISFLE